MRSAASPGLDNRFPRMLAGSESGWDNKARRMKSGVSRFWRRLASSATAISRVCSTFLVLSWVKFWIMALSLPG
jgi:hypothetical protein